MKNGKKRSKCTKRYLTNKRLISRFSFRHTFHGNAINERVVKPHRYKYPAFIAITFFLRHLDSAHKIHLWINYTPGVLLCKLFVTCKEVIEWRNIEKSLW